MIFEGFFGRHLKEGSRTGPGGDAMEGASPVLGGNSDSVGESVSKSDPADAQK